LDTTGTTTNAAQGEAVSVKIPGPLASRINRRLANSDFKSVDEYVAYVLDQVLSEIEGDVPGAGKSAENVFSNEDQASVEQRLRDLGYM
jgi:hypothetical protein